MTMDCRDELKGSLDDRFLGTGAHDVGRGALAEQQRERVDDHRFARARFARQNVEAGLEGKSYVGNDGKIADAELSQHLLARPIGQVAPLQLAAESLEETLGT